MGVLLSFFFSVSGIQTVVACTVLRRVRNLGATKGSNWQNSASRKEDARKRELEGAWQILRMPWFQSCRLRYWGGCKENRGGIYNEVSLVHFFSCFFPFCTIHRWRTQPSITCAYTGRQVHKLQGNYKILTPESVISLCFKVVERFPKNSGNWSGYRPDSPLSKMAWKRLWVFLTETWSKRFLRSSIRAIFVWPWKMVSVSVRYFFFSQWMKRSKHGLFVFPPKKTLIWRRHYSIGQSCCSMMSKWSIGWFLESSRGWSFFTRTFA